MTRALLAMLLVACACIPACQCSDKPEIGPVEGSSSVRAVPAGETAVPVALPA